ncbi:MAG: T9SS type A sorting domain-containing protein, partial [Bacteroidia bacterium]|nr:T9SS type A sorting domain-containing protein [Bacteroidia bacterium]
NAVIQANRFICSKGSLRRDPLTGKIPFYHVQLHNVCSTCTSSASLPLIGRDVASKGNLFENAFGGISLIDAKASVYNNTFSNIFNKNGTYHSSHYGTGIFVENRQTSNGRIFIGGENAYEPNTFSNVNIGLLVINRRKDFEITVAGNSFDNSSFGLQGQGSGSNFYNTALSFNYQINGTKPLDIFIFKNAILNHRIGIHAINYNNIKIGMNASSSFGTGFTNTIRYNLGSSPAPDIHYKGIWLQNCSGAKVVSNEISNDVPATGTDNFRGIDMEASNDCRINCNTITNLPRSINFTGNCNLTKLKYNIMSGYDHGVHLEPNTLLPAQGDLDANSGQYFPYDNWWGYTGTEPPSVLKVSEANTPILWYYQGATSPLNPYYPLPATFNIVPIFTPNSGNNDCLDFARYESRENSIAKTVNDSLEFDEYPEENMYQAKMVVYKALKQDSALIHQGKPDDHVYEYFVACMDAGNMGLLDSVGTLMNDSTTFLIASNINSSINDTNNVEYFSKTMHEIQLTLFATGELSPSDSATLDYIAHLPLTLAGNAIYTAAAILGLEIHQQFSSEARKSDVNPKKEKPLTKNDVFMYPNPAFDKAYFYLKPLVAENLALIEIYDNAGNKIMMLPADTYKIHEVNVQSFAAGLYSYRVICNNREFKGTFSKFK